MSSGVPARRTGVRAMASATPPSPNSPRASDSRNIGVSMKPGGMAFTVTPRAPNSSARDLVNPLSPDLDET